MSQATNVRRGPGYVTCSVDTVAILLWLGSPTIEGVNACGRVLIDCQARNPRRKLGLLTVITVPAGQGTLSPPVRDALVEMLKTHEAALQASAIVFEGGGFRATVVRSVVTAIQMLVRPKFASGVYAEREPALAKLLRQLANHTQLEAAELSAIVQELLTAPDVQEAV